MTEKVDFKLENKHVIIYDKNIIEKLISNNIIRFVESNKIKSDILFNKFRILKSVNDSRIKRLTNFVYNIFKKRIDFIEDNLRNNDITYNNLIYLFNDGVKCHYYDNDIDDIVGINITDARYHNDMFGKYFCISGNYLIYNGKRYIAQETRKIVVEYRGSKKLNELPIKLMNDDVLKKLEIRGKIYTDLVNKCHYKNYEGNIIYKTWYGVKSYRATGRVMVDHLNFTKVNHGYIDRGGDTIDSNMFHNNENLYRMSPSLLGYSLVAKQWGEISLKNISDIKFDDNAYNRLVLEPNTKKIIRAIVENQDDVKDIITGKGCGNIFLLHGLSGCGKTTTAESISELLHKPLYSVSSGELGTTTKELENKLEEVLEITTKWNAIILIDEADIFLEKRTSNDIHRNGMVGIFLKLLEYHKGVMFLTTNRVKSFDPAFYSRITLAIHYDELTKESRYKIWNNFLSSDGFNLKKLSEFKLNGRQIRSIVKLASSIAKSENIPLNEDHLIKMINAQMDFNKFVEE